MSLLLTLRAWRDSSAEQATPAELKARSLLPSLPLALAGRGSLGLQGWLSPRGGLLAAAGGGARSSPSPTLRRWQLCAEEPGWGAHGAGTAGAGPPRSRAGARTGRRSGCAGSRRWRRRQRQQHPLYLRFPSVSFSSLFSFPLRSPGRPGSFHGGVLALRVSCDRGCVHFPRPGKTSSRLAQPGPSSCASAREEPPAQRMETGPAGLYWSGPLCHGRESEQVGAVQA